MTKTKISWFLGVLVSLIAIYAFLPPGAQLATKADTQAVVARFEPVECDTLENSLRRLRNDRREYQRELKQDPDDDFAILRIDEIELEIREKEAKRGELGCG